MSGQEFLPLWLTKCLKVIELDLPQRKQEKHHAGFNIYISCKAANVALKEIVVEIQGETQQTIQELVEIW